jgi:excisionase family DNA binding protein
LERLPFFVCGEGVIDGPLATTRRETQMEEDTRALLRPADLAPMLGVTRVRVYQMLAANELPSVRQGKRIYIPRAAWEQWLAELTDRAVASVHEPADTLASCSELPYAS